MKKLLQVKRVETKKNYVTRKGTIKVADTNKLKNDLGKVSSSI